jgi:hypothetical protein
MCFSPAASFATAGVTGLIGVLCLRRVRGPGDLPLAMVPLLFAAQQAIEGALWLYLPNDAHGGAAGDTNTLMAGAAYLAATVLPLVLSSRRPVLVLGAVTGIGCAIAYVFCWQPFLSVWCFFAAAGSVVILTHFELAHRAPPHPAAVS